MAAVVSTQRGVGASLESFLRWHLERLRFDHVYIYLDAPQDDVEAVRIGREPAWFGRLTIVQASEAFRTREYHSLPSWRAVAQTAASMVQSRQRLNCEHCLGLCRAAGHRWLLHIDSDELFFPGPTEDAQAHFQRLDAKGCWQFTYRNLEAVPTLADGSNGDPFASVSVFKQHEDELPVGALDGVGTEAHAALAFWLERAIERTGSPAWFFFYSNGKSAVRVDAAVTLDAATQAGPGRECVSGPRLCCPGVHGWSYSDADGMTEPRQGWLTNLRKVAQRSSLRELDASERAVVLHYACCTAQEFACKDWRALGYLGGGGGAWAKRWDRMQREQSPGDAVPTLDGGRDAAARLASEHGALFGLEDAAALRRHVAAGVLLRVERVRDFLLGRACDSGIDSLGGLAPPGALDESQPVDDAGDGSSSECDDDEYRRLREAQYARLAGGRIRSRSTAAEPATAVPAVGGGDVDDAGVGEGLLNSAPGGGSLSSSGFGKTTEEIEEFLLAALMEKEKGQQDGRPTAPSEHYRQNVRSW